MQEPVTPTKPKRVRRKVKKLLDFTDPFLRADPRLLEKMHREALKLRKDDLLVRLGDALL
jgi:hypothetical protein